MKYSVAWLADQPRWEGIFFWGHRQKNDGIVDKSCCSQWFPAGFTVDGVRYRTAEHWMMAGKARLFGDEAILASILESADVREVKALGRKVAGFDPDRWGAFAPDHVAEGNFHKFEQNPKLRAWLEGTQGKVLVEAAPNDRVWGIGLGANDDRCRDVRTWQGTNGLGFAIMHARDRLFGE